MKKQTSLNWLIILIASLPAIYLAIMWSSVPHIIALHFNSKMQPDKMGDKTELWIPVGIIWIVSIGIFFLFRNIHLLDPKQKTSLRSGTFIKLATGIVVFMAALNFMIIISAIKGSFMLEHFLFPLLGLLFAFMGNYMNNIKPNYFAGFRLPWTLSDDENWRRTHHLASKLWFSGGIVILIAGLFLSIKIMLPVFIVLMVIMIIIPAVYSYRMFREKRRA